MRKPMKNLAVMFGAAAILALPAVAMTTEGDPEKEGKVVAQTMVEEHAIVKAIDMKTRTVTLQMSDGREHTLVVDKAVKKLGEVKVGDTVKANYREAVSVKINKVKVAPGASVQTAIKRDEKSLRPSGTASMTATTTATIDKIFDDGKKVTLRTPDGETTDVEVRDPENLAKIKKGEVKEGDQIQITYNRALAISVEKTAKK